MMRASAIPADAPDLKSALEAANLPTEDLADPGRNFFRFEDGGQVVGYAGYELYDREALLRSLVVVPEARGRGYGRQVTEAVLEQARGAGAHDAYLLTTSAESFFEHTGFRKIARSGAPASILATRQAASICSSAALLTRTIDKA